MKEKIQTVNRSVKDVVVAAEAVAEAQLDYWWCCSCTFQEEQKWENWTQEGIQKKETDSRQRKWKSTATDNPCKRPSVARQSQEKNWYSKYKSDLHDVTVNPQ